MPYPSSSPVQTGGVRSSETPSPPDILTYCYGSRMVYVTTAETYDQAIDFAQDEFPELKDVERGRIRLAVRVALTGNPRRQSAEIGRSAWSAVVSALTRFEIVEIQLVEPPAAPSGLRSSSVAEPPPSYETGAVSDMKKVSATATNLFGSGSQVPSSQSQSQSQSHLQPQSLTNRLARLLSRSSRGHYPS